MFSKAKRFEPLVPSKTKPKTQISTDSSSKTKIPSAAKPKLHSAPASKINFDSQSLCSSSVKSIKSFATPQQLKNIPSQHAKNLKPPLSAKSTNKKVDNKLQDDMLKAHEVEIRNKDYTIKEYVKQIEELKCEISNLQKTLKDKTNSEINKINENFKQIDINNDEENDFVDEDKENISNFDDVRKNLVYQIQKLQNQCKSLEEEVNSKQVELTSLEDVITIRDSLCADLQKKLSDVESCLDETRQRLEMVKGHHALALEANESIRREYKLELETLKSRLDEEKQAIISKSKADLENLKINYTNIIETLRNQIANEKDDKIYELQKLLASKEKEMKAKLEQVNEASREKLKLCEIQFEERTSSLQEHWSQQQILIKELENEVANLNIKINENIESKADLQKKITDLQDERNTLELNLEQLQRELKEIKEDSKNKTTNMENEISNLKLEIDRVTKEKNKFEMSLSVTRDIVQVLTMRLRESDNEVEHLEKQVQTLSHTKDVLEEELATYKNSLNNTILECNEYKEALVNILKSKAALAKEHNRIMEHNVTLIESLQNVEKEAYRELGSIKSELIEDVELIKKESSSQIKMLRDEVEKKRLLCELATEHAGQASAAAEQSRVLLARAASDLQRLEADNRRLQSQIQDQQSLVVELSLLRQENEELSMNLAKQTSIIDKMKKEADQVDTKPKSPSLFRKTQKIGKENVQIVVSPLRERNH
ncbi:interaptin-like [Aricia agestis]|uniref:interaptin-like n=1 Tax=Aricia agestis TaxID=91739 RepID=UPI001C20281D|nr:interaptin-like [Aricia agestis]